MYLPLSTCPRSGSTGALPGTEAIASDVPQVGQKRGEPSTGPWQDGHCIGPPNRLTVWVPPHALG